MLSLSIRKGPLDNSLNAAILRGYIELAHAKVSPENFRRWMQESPCGPALHAILTADNGKLAGHCCLFPIPMARDGERTTIAKAEYFFLRSEFRKETVHGFDKSIKPASILLLESLYRSGSQFGWGWYLVSAPTEVAPLHRMAGCKKVSISLTECLLTFRPWMAAVNTPNIGAGQRAALAMAGSVQRTFWALPRKTDSAVREISVDAPSSNHHVAPGISLTSDVDFANWRYGTSEFRRLQLDGSDKSWIVAKKGSSSEYLRVCQSSPDLDEQNAERLVKSLIKIALRERALGVRWALYDDGSLQHRLVPVLRQLGFLCMKRERTIYVRRSASSGETPAWQLQDSLFCFDS